MSDEIDKAVTRIHLAYVGTVLALLLMACGPDCDEGNTVSINQRCDDDGCIADYEARCINGHWWSRGDRSVLVKERDRLRALLSDEPR